MLARMTSEPIPLESARREELLERAYRYTLEHGVAGLSLRPLATAIGSSPRVLLFLFGSKEGLVRALLRRARSDELALLAQLGSPSAGGDLRAVAAALWDWLAADEHRGVLRVWAEAYARSLVDPSGPWAGFAEATVADWLELLAGAQEPEERSAPDAEAERTLTLAVLRGCLLDLLATTDVRRTTAAVKRHLRS
jgi:AcrR family transcriptional regulator